MSQNFWYPPGSQSASSIEANQGDPNTLANAWPVKITDGTDLALVNASGELLVAASALPLPSGAASAANQLLEIAAIDAVGDQLPATLGAKTGALSLAIVGASDTSLSGSGSALNDLVIPSTEVKDYQSISLQVTANASNNTVTWEFSNDNSTWVGATGFITIGTAQQQLPTSGGNTASMYIIPVVGRYFRLRISSYIGGSVTAVAMLAATVGPDISQTVNAIQSGNFTVRNQDGSGTSLGSNYGSAAAALRVAAQIGNASAVADFNAGNASAQTLRTVIATDQATIPVSLASAPLPSGVALESKQSPTDIVDNYDYRSISYVGATDRIDTIVYKTGGSGGTTVATQTYGYDGSDRLTSITTT